MRALETHVIKKYANRKLYDTFSRRYVTLEVIAELLRDGHEVRVVDRTSGEDITAVTLSQILLDLERQRRGPQPEAARRCGTGWGWADGHRVPYSRRVPGGP